MHTYRRERTNRQTHKRNSNKLIRINFSECVRQRASSRYCRLKSLLSIPQKSTKKTHNFHFYIEKLFLLYLMCVCVRYSVQNIFGSNGRTERFLCALCVCSSKSIYICSAWVKRKSWIGICAEKWIACPFIK